MYILFGAGLKARLTFPMLIGDQCSQLPTRTNEIKIKHEVAAAVAR